ncbi:hypothetical protein BU26DRAFT_23881 [Trematosphaeria pertusa]|uniref:Extracellular membrane protein CFEM domain-containing protein n=1 Tax=Trematosphaeria pertusa TaxID=390896 RepID=A0A6A6J2U1_9PLEO|nr:uncharacterized protein BU26DRAFT_23881 [Trematosphaeria pertusa]KAF2256532.1 hypothetical protein BU26DRAFT_23881 [Trematosphaeria pertusa]
MKLPLSLIALWLSAALAQTYPECTRALVETDECASVINANACYNKFRFQNAQTMQCIDGTDNADKAKKICKCCSCVGAIMCNWATKQKLC